MVDVTIGGQTPESITSVRTEDTPSDGTGESLGEAIVQMRDTTSNRNFSPDADVSIDWGPVIWKGSVAGQPSESGGRLTIRALGEALPLKHQQAYRVFYETKRSEAVKALASEQTEQLPETVIYTGDDPANWSSVAPAAEPYAGSRAALYRFGTDMLFIGAREGHSTELQATYENVPSDAIEKGIFELFTRLIFVDASGIWDLVIELREPGDGTAYRWTPDIEFGAHIYELPVEEAESDHSGINPGELRYRLIPKGTIAEPTGMMIDHATTIPFRTRSRTNALNVSDVDASEGTITRRVDGPIGQAIADVATEDAAAVYVDGGLSYKPGEPELTDTGLTIEQGSIPVTSAFSVERDYEGIRNEVLIAGDDGVEALERDQASINYYGRVRPERIDDPSITSQAEAEDRAKGFLEKNAWNDAAPTFPITDLSYAAVSAGEKIPVEWSNEGLSGRYPVRKVVAKHTGIVEITVEASSGR